VIHTVGPVWQGGNQNEDRLLSNCYTKSLQLAVDYQLKSIAFPNISTGVYGFPKERAAGIAIGTVKQFLEDSGASLEISFVVFDPENELLYRRLLGSDLEQ
jgi:O-acetyl-ADP-ribose deacetylase (regulator of RNase III)